MNGDFDFFVDSRPSGDSPVPGNLVPCLIYCGHDCVCPTSSPDQKPEPSLVREADTGASPTADSSSYAVQDGHSCLVDVLGIHGRIHFGLRFSPGEVPNKILPAEGVSPSPDSPVP
jgi:hypothetical protein